MDLCLGCHMKVLPLVTAASPYPHNRSLSYAVHLPQKEQQLAVLDPTPGVHELPHGAALEEEAQAMRLDVEKGRVALANLDTVVAKAGEASNTDSPAPEVSGGGGGRVQCMLFWYGTMGTDVLRVLPRSCPPLFSSGLTPPINLILCFAPTGGGGAGAAEGGAA